jgi:hypothetical protein
MRLLGKLLSNFWQTCDVLSSLYHLLPSLLFHIIALLLGFVLDYLHLQAAASIKSIEKSPQGSQLQKGTKIDPKINLWIDAGLQGAGGRFVSKTLILIAHRIPIRGNNASKSAEKGNANR